MGGFVEKLRLAEKAAEDIYFAKVSHELIEALHKRIQAEKNSFQPSDQSSAELSRDWAVKPPEKKNNSYSPGITSDCLPLHGDGNE